MGSYYNSSVLTIAASFCPGDSGFLAPRKHWKGDLLQLPYRDASGKHKGSFYLAPTATLPAAEYHQVSRESALANRGWVFQEWLLSRRIIYYTQQSTWMECLTDAPRNDMRDSATSDTLDPALQPSSATELVRFKQNFHTGSSPWQVLWSRVIELYSACRLTRPLKDRLVAIAGIAEHIRGIILADSGRHIAKRASDHAYIAGWWYGDIHRGLLWEQDRRAKREEPIWTSPSWSWAHHYGSVLWRTPWVPTSPAFHLSDLTSGDEEVPADDPLQSGYLASGLGPEDVEMNAKYLNINKRFACLGIRGKVGRVLIGLPLRCMDERQDTASKLADYTGVDGRPTDQDRWCTISSLDSPDEIIGWADLDPDTGVFSAASAGDLPPHRPILQALHVCTQKNVEGGWAFGLRGLSHEVYAVLFIARLRSGRYVRAGMARIFQQDFFKGVYETTIELT